jgi:hypothetical protein
MKSEKNRGQAPRTSMHVKSSLVASMMKVKNGVESREQSRKSGVRVRSSHPVNVIRRRFNIKIVKHASKKAPSKHIVGSEMSGASRHGSDHGHVADYAPGGPPGAWP